MSCCSKRGGGGGVDGTGREGKTPIPSQRRVKTLVELCLPVIAKHLNLFADKQLLVDEASFRHILTMAGTRVNAEIAERLCQSNSKMKKEIDQVIWKRLYLQKFHGNSKMLDVTQRANDGDVSWHKAYRRGEKVRAKMLKKGAKLVEKRNAEHIRERRSHRTKKLKLVSSSSITHSSGNEPRRSNSKPSTRLSDLKSNTPSSSSKGTARRR